MKRLLSLTVLALIFSASASADTLKFVSNTSTKCPLMTSLTVYDAANPGTNVTLLLGGASVFNAGLTGGMACVAQINGGCGCSLNFDLQAGTWVWPCNGGLPADRVRITVALVSGIYEITLSDY